MCRQLQHEEQYTKNAWDVKKKSEMAPQIYATLIEVYIWGANPKLKSLKFHFEITLNSSQVLLLFHGSPEAMTLSTTWFFVKKTYALCY